ncbi:MAG TPA: FtsW/RodA/SpoVE family cell cycle protein [Candidatus Competibacter sp.]|nr:FtsW/RodA/SpoVE family cell cycle protein [Candidatus Competibacter sp.]
MRNRIAEAEKRGTGLEIRPDVDKSMRPARRVGRWWLFWLWLLPVLGVAWTAYRAPAWLEPRSLTVRLEPGQSATLGRETLWAPRADREHVLIRRDAQNGWWLANLSADKKVLWRPALESHDQAVRDWPLMPGAAFVVGTESFSVVAAETRRLVLQGGGRRWEYDGLRLHRDGQPLPECRPGWRTRFREWFESPGLLNGLVRRPLRLGGGVYCADRLGLAGVPVDTAIIEPAPAGFTLCPGDAGRSGGPPVTVAAGTPDAESLWQRSVPLAVGDRLVVGRTQYRVAQIEPVLALATIARAQRWPAGSTPPTVSPVVSVEWRPMAWLRSFGSRTMDWWFGLVLSPLVLGSVWSKRQRERPRIDVHWQAALALTLAGACLVAYWNSLTVPVLWPYLLAWPALLVWLGAVRSPWSAGLLGALVLLLGGGLITLLQLGVGASESGWQRYGASGAALAGAFGWLAWAGWRCRCWRWLAARPDSRWARWSSWSLGAASLALLSGQIVFGDESGWGGWQPFELTKLALVMVAAYALTLRAQSWESGWNAGKPSPWLRYLGPLALLSATSAFALVFLRDFSPLVLLLCWALGLAWAYLRAHPRSLRRRLGRLIVIGLVLSAVAGLAWLREWPEDFPLDFQADRVRVWATPDQYPHAGYQLRRALEAIRAGGWWGAVWADTTNGRAMAIPAVQNDFTPAFFLNRYGGVAALALAGIQAMLIALMLAIADRALERARRDDGGPDALGWFAHFALYGGAALLGAHFLVSWGTNLGFLPVMGQPMSLLSAAGSHLVLFVLPIVALAVAVEEKIYGDPT